MKSAPKSFFLLCVFFTTVSAVSKAPKGCFRAATLDHVQQVVGNPFIPTLENLKKEIELNLKMYEKAATMAKENNADVIQFPEEGIQFGYPRKLALVLGEALPAAPTDFTYCSEEFLETPVLRGLACIAQKNKMFVSADILDVQPFTPTPERNSSRDNVLIYNTQVVFDREGRLIAKYHKQNLFNEPEKDRDLNQAPVAVDTEIGRLGLNICFDLLFSQPGHKLAVDGLVDTILYPTWWLDELPFLQASQIQAGFARGHDINLIASNNHNVSRGARGSGIYAGNSSDFATINDLDGKTKLLIANLPIHPRSQVCEMESVIEEIPQENEILQPETYFHLNMVKSDEIQMKRIDLTGKEERMMVNKYIYCFVMFQAVNETINEQEEYYLIAGNRTKPGSFPWNEQFCAVVQCPKNEKEPCKEFQQDTPLKTRFHFIMVSGGFSPEVQPFPTLIGDMHQVVSLNKANNATAIEVKRPDGHGVGVAQGGMNGNFTFPIGTIGIYGRDYRHDKPYENIKLEGIIKS